MVLRKFLPLLFISTCVMAQDDLAHHVKLIKQLMPDATRVGILFNPNTEIDGLINRAVQETGIKIIKSPIASVRDVSTAVRNLDRYDVDFVIMIEERVVTSNNAIKYVVKQTVKKKIPVFTTSENAMSAGACGHLVNGAGTWQMKVNGKVVRLFDITVPDSNANITLEQ